MFPPAYERYSVSSEDTNISSYIYVVYIHNQKEKNQKTANSTTVNEVQIAVII